MADVTIESAILENGKLTVTGTGFTKTTTVVEIDGNQVAFEIPAEVTDGSKLIVADVAEGASEVDVTKGEVTASATIGGADQSGASSGGDPENPYPDQPTEDDDLADATPGQLAEVDYKRAGEGTQNPAPAELSTYESKSHLPGTNVQETVANTKLDRIEEEWGIGPRDPYPTGNPQDPEDVHQRLHGYRRDSEPEKQDQLDANPAT